MDTDEAPNENDQYEYQKCDVQLLAAAADGNIETCRKLIEKEGADPCFQVLQTGVSVLMAAAGSGHKEIVQFLLDEGAPWNAVDRDYLCAGDYAAQNGHQDCVDCLLNHAVMAEMILSLAKSDLDIHLDQGDDEEPDAFTEMIATKRPRLEEDKNDSEPNKLNASYLSSRLEYSNDGKRLTDKSTDLAVMMDWEKPLMQEHAEFICHGVDGQPTLNCTQLKVLNVGFGMGIVDTAIQSFKPGCHVVIEAHDQILKHIEEIGFDKLPGVWIVKGRWQDAVKMLADEIERGTKPPFDGIFFDTYAEDDQDLRNFHAFLPKLLRPGTGRYSYYNGLCPDNVFFHGVACETFKLQLQRLGLSCDFKSIPVDVADPSIWKDLKNRYWYFDTYFLPKCILNK